MKKLTYVFLLLLFPISFAQCKDDYCLYEGEFYISGTILRKPFCQLAESEILDLGTMTTEMKQSDWGSIDLQFYDCDIRTDENPQGNTTGVSLAISPDLNPSAPLWENRDGSAENVGIRLRIEGRDISPQGTGSQPLVKDAGADGTVSFKIEAQMVATGQVSVGSVKRHISFVATYK